MKFQETARQFKETDLKFQETARQFKETDMKFQETDRQLKETDLRLRKLDELFESQWGKLMESLVEGDLVGILNRQGIEISDTTTRLKGRIAGGGNYEFDIVAHNGHEIVVVEVKTTLRPQDVRKFIYKLENIKQWIPRYAGNTIYGGMAWLTTTAGAEEMAETEPFGGFGCWPSMARKSSCPTPTKCVRNLGRLPIPMATPQNVKASVPMPRRRCCMTC